ncbi:MAG: M3 family metallopeptidase [Bacteroidales bacterium]|nr:M3 family metallopeptidase [Bacteroidales bacterium]MBR5780767.1 M3 family metallopeptidase [Bacteroidales bacterium]
MNNPLLTTSTLPYGAPQFDKIENHHYIPAFKQAIEEAKAEVDAIINNTDTPTFENTIEALEYAGSTLNRISHIFYNLLEADTNDEMQNIAEEITPLTTEFSMYVSLNESLFQRVKQIHDTKELLNLDAEETRLLEKTYKGFARNGANLSPENKEIYSKYIEELSLLSLQFGKNVLAATNAFSLNLIDEKDLIGLPDYVREQAADDAKNKGVNGWLFNLTAPSYIPFMKFSERRDLREKMYREYNTRAFKGELDNSQIIKRIAELRILTAKLLGYTNFAEYQTERRMVKTPEAVNEFLNKLLIPALPKARHEVEDLNTFAKANGFTEEQLMPWDFSFYAEKLRLERYNLSDEQLKPYFQLEQCINAIFNLANKLYGLTFNELNNMPVYHDDVKVYDVKDKDGSHLALFYADFFPRESKRGGAWMTEFRGQRIYKGTDERPLISIVTNFTKPTADTPSLITHDEFTTLLHEFGHALHGILTKGRYESMTGTSVDHDFVELPSQIMENWCYEPEYLNTFAKHYQTDETIPNELIEKIVESKNYLSAYYHIRQLQFGILDMAWHNLTEIFDEDSLTFEKNALSATNVLPSIPECIISTAFSHIFAGGYCAGYYSYKWAEVLAADGFSLFKEKGIFNLDIANSFRELLTKGDSIDAAVLYRNFRGHDPEPEALLRQLKIKN